jgi:hypothetical protein
MKIFVFLSFLGLSFCSQAQDLKKVLLGKWKLTSLIGKQASAFELTKRYEFTATDTAYFSNSRNRLTVKYEIDEAKQQLTLIRTGFPTAYLSVKILSPNKIELKDLSNENSAPGIIEREVE